MEWNKISRQKEISILGKRWYKYDIKKWIYIFTFRIVNSSYWTSLIRCYIHCQSEAQALIIDAVVSCAAITAIHLCNFIVYETRQRRNGTQYKSMLSVFVVLQKFTFCCFGSWNCYYFLFSVLSKETQKKIWTKPISRAFRIAMWPKLEQHKKHVNGIQRKKNNCE